MGKRVAILSMQRVVNYGSFLQAWALRELLLAAGAGEVDFMDIRPGRQLTGYRSTGAAFYRRQAKKLSGALLSGNIGSEIRDRRFYRALREQFHGRFYGMLGLDGSAKENPDIAVIGSDEVFNCCQPSPWGFTTQLYGDIPRAGRVATYAASFGSTTYGQLTEYGLTGEISGAMSHIGCLSVRDDNSARIVERLTGRTPLMHFDPVLIHDFAPEYHGLESGLENAMLIYSYTGRINDKREIKEIREFAHSRGLKLVSLMSRYDWCDEALLPETPFHVLAYFRDADYVVTDTFHGTIFSVITESRFCTLVRDSNRQKLTSLLAGLGLSERATATPPEIARILESEFDSDRVREIVGKERIRTADYLKKVVNGKVNNFTETGK